MVNKQPTYICPNTNKLYGGEYDLKIGLMSADEVSFAGGIRGTSNEDYYIFKSSEYRWLNSPVDFIENNAHEFDINASGSTLSGYYVYVESSIVPVLNLRSNTLFTGGNGTKEEPYVIKLKTVTK